MLFISSQNPVICARELYCLLPAIMLPIPLRCQIVKMHLKFLQPRFNKSRQIYIHISPLFVLHIDLYIYISQCGVQIKLLLLLLNTRQGHNKRKCHNNGRHRHNTLQSHTIRQDHYSSHIHNTRRKPKRKPLIKHCFRVRSQPARSCSNRSTLTGVIRELPRRLS